MDIVTGLLVSALGAFAGIGIWVMYYRFRGYEIVVRPKPKGDRESACP